MVSRSVPIELRTSNTCSLSYVSYTFLHKAIFKKRGERMKEIGMHIIKEL